MWVIDILDDFTILMRAQRARILRTTILRKSSFGSYHCEYQTADCVHQGNAMMIFV
jgi:hypothetical protein